MSVKEMLNETVLLGPKRGICSQSSAQHIEYLNLRIEAMDKEIRRLRKLKNK